MTIEEIEKMAANRKALRDAFNEWLDLTDDLIQRENAIRNLRIDMLDYMVPGPPRGKS